MTAARTLPRSGLLRLSASIAPARHGASLLAAATTRGLATAAPPVTWTPSPASKPATLHLKSGHSWQGKSFGAPIPKTFGEVVFTTAITSYTESLTDPSYQGQILTFTSPLMGNYGVPNNFSGISPVGNELDVDVGSFLESRGVQAAGVVVSNLAERFSHFEAIESLATWCARHNVPGISGVDTRAVTTLLRDQGSTLGGIKIGEGHEITPAPEDFIDPMQEVLIDRVSTKQPYVVHPVGGKEKAKVHVALLDFGSKANIIRCLIRQGASVTVLPWNYDFYSVKDKFDGLFLSNGPGSPTTIPEAVENVRKTIQDISYPVAGICMGNQIIGLAAGIPVIRLKHGNRGHNQPVLHLLDLGESFKKGKVSLSSQNHQYALSWDHSNPWKGWFPLSVNANDASIEGIASTTPGHVCWGLQYHPEASGGPDDAHGFFGEWIKAVVQKKNEKGAMGLAPGLQVEEMIAMPSGPFGRGEVLTIDQLKL